MVTRILRLLKHRFVAMIYKVRTSALVRRLIVYLFDKRYRDQTATENELCIKISNQIKQHGYCKRGERPFWKRAHPCFRGKC